MADSAVRTRFTVDGFACYVPEVVATLRNENGLPREAVLNSMTSLFVSFPLPDQRPSGMNSSSVDSLSERMNKSSRYGSEVRARIRMIENMISPSLYEMFFH